MPETEQNHQNEFMIEKIKQRPVNKRKLIQRTIITASMAVIFGLIACFTFLVLEPVISNWLYPEEEPPIVVLPEDQEEMSPEEMLSDYMQAENQQNQTTEPSENITLEEEQIQQILEGITLNRDNYRELYTVMSEYTAELNRYMVTVTGVTSNIDWFDNVEESRNQASGLVIADNGKELLILVDDSALQKAELLMVTFYNNLQIQAQWKAQDPNTSLAVLAVDLNELSENMAEDEIYIAPLGSSSSRNIVGTPVVALGSPMGITGSVGYGMITATSSQLTVADTNYKFLQTDIVGSQNAGGVLFNLQGQVIGIITNHSSGTDMRNMVTAYGITELKKNIEKMSNGEKAAYLGIRGTDVSRQANEELGVPYGAYVREIDMNSPVMLAGVQRGDILVAIGDKNITGYGEYTSVLMGLHAGDTVELTIMRQAQEQYREMKLQVTLGEVK